MIKEEIKERICRRRRQMLVHSYIYYCLYDSLISDDKWQDWANELRELQETHGWEVGFYDEEFKDWRGDTGYHLPKDGWIYDKAMMLLRYEGNQND